jgi:hypothetical protein
MTRLVATIFSAALQNGELERMTGFLVPDTENLFAVDERWQDHWRVTHVPSGRAVMPPFKAELSVKEQAVGFAQRFYREAMALGADLTCKDFEAIRRTMWFERGLGEREAFSMRVI